MVKPSPFRKAWLLETGAELSDITSRITLTKRKGNRPNVTVWISVPVKK